MTPSTQLNCAALDHEDPTSAKMYSKQKNKEQSRQRKRENDLKKTENEIFELETRDTEINELMTQEEVYTNAAECQKLHREQEEIKSRLEALYEQWETLAQ